GPIVSPRGGHVYRITIGAAVPPNRSDRELATTIKDVRAPALSALTARLSLLVIGDGVHATHALPEGGEVVIGRSDQADVRIDERSISRRHALVRLGQSLTIEDLGSANGTRVRGETIAPGKSVTIAVGETVDLGSIMIIVQARGTTARPRRLW